MLKDMILNFPAYASSCSYIVANDIDGELWFYGAYDSESKALAAARFIGHGVVYYNWERR